MSTSEWSQMLVERRAAPEPLSESEFRAWMDRRPIFISSTIDDETRPLRAAARDTVSDLGGEPVIWESITPRDQRAQDAYLEGVDRSSLLVLLVGARYGITDESGYSATHKEVIRAGDRAIPRLLFELSGVSPSDRDGRLNDWLRSIYSEVSTAQAADERELGTKLEARLRELSASQERTWIKLGRLVFPGQVERSTGQSGSTVTVTASVREPALRRDLNDVAGAPHRAGDRLTWGVNSEQAQVRRVEIRTPTASRDDVIITIPDVVRSFFGGERESLPEILAALSASGWLAEGLSRLFVVESILDKFGGYFDTLEVGPATANGVRLSLAHVSGSDDVAHVTGVIPLRGGS